MAQWQQGVVGAVERIRRLPVAPGAGNEPADREINPGGFVEIAYSSKSELPATRRE
jgi:hypothetical protein